MSMIWAFEARVVGGVLARPACLRASLSDDSTLHGHGGHKGILVAWAILLERAVIDTSQYMRTANWYWSATTV